MIAELQKKEGAFLGSHISFSRIGSFLGYLVSGAIVPAGGIPFLFLANGILVGIALLLSQRRLALHKPIVEAPRRVLHVLFRFP